MRAERMFAQPNHDTSLQRTTKNEQLKLLAYFANEWCLIFSKQIFSRTGKKKEAKNQAIQNFLFSSILCPKFSVVVLHAKIPETRFIIREHTLKIQLKKPSLFWCLIAGQLRNEAYKIFSDFIFNHGWCVCCFASWSSHSVWERKKSSHRSPPVFLTVGTLQTLKQVTKL